MVQSSFRKGLEFALVASCSACGAAHHSLAGYPVAHEQVAILIKISDEVNQADDGGGVATLAETVSTGLKDNGVDSQIYASKYDRAPPPRIELNVLYWHGTSAISHQLAAAGYVVPGASLGALATAGNRIIVDCSVFLPGKAEPVYRHRFDHSGIGIGLTATDDTAAASNAGEAIVSKVLTP